MSSSNSQHCKNLPAPIETVLAVGDVPRPSIGALLHRYGLEIHLQADCEQIAGSYWGGAEAGIIGKTVYVRADTPVHSLLHETCHIVCMTSERRENLNRDAGGDELEEAAACFLQIVLADQIEGLGRERIMLDMDTWGYSFRLGDTRSWYANDADDARKWLIDRGLLSADGEATFRLCA